MNGRALFTYNPDLFVDDANAGTEQDYEEDETEGESKIDSTTNKEESK